LIFGLVLVSRDCEVGTNVSCEESTVSTCIRLILKVILWYTDVVPGRVMLQHIAPLGYTDRSKMVKTQGNVS